VILEPMQPLVVDLMALRAFTTAELRIVPGRALMARVAQTGPPGRGLLSIAGELVEADLPHHVRAGDELRLVVRHVSAGRVELSLSDRAAPPPPAEAPVPLPGGATLRVADEAPGRHGPRTDAPGTHALALEYEAPALGRLDLHFVLDAGSLRLAVRLPAGRPFEFAQQDADDLRQTLSENLGRSVELTIQPRHEPLDVYA
jgi:hypothetical protein